MLAPPPQPPLAPIAAELAQAPLAPHSPQVLPADLQPLVKALKQYGFQVSISTPPARGVYGLFEPVRRRIWVAPITLELGIARQTFLHEATHAAQSCPSGRVVPIGWRLPVVPVVRQEISGILTTRYQHDKVAEQEAFALQGQPDAVERLLKALRSRCGARTGTPR